MRWIKAMLNKRNIQFSLMTLLVLSMIAGGTMTWLSWRHARWARQLADPAQRDEAFFNLLKYQRLHDPDGHRQEIPASLSDCVVNHVVVVPQASGPPYYLVFRRSDLQGGPGIAKGHSYLFDSEGFLIPWYWNSNYITGEVFAIPTGPPLLVVDYTEYEGINVMYVTELSARHNVPILRVQLRSSGVDDNHLGWQFHIDNSAGEVAIEVQRRKRSNDLVTRARYVWSNSEKKFVGPKGGPDEDFMRIDDPHWREKFKRSKPSQGPFTPTKRLGHEP